MRTAVENYSRYLRGADRAALGRFIVPLTRLDEFEDAAADQFPRSKAGAPWRISVLVADDVRDAARDMEKFNARYSGNGRRGRATIDVAEMNAATIEAVPNQQPDLPPAFPAHSEI